MQPLPSGNPSHIQPQLHSVRLILLCKWMRWSWGFQTWNCLGHNEKNPLPGYHSPLYLWSCHSISYVCLNGNNQKLPFPQAVVLYSIKHTVRRTEFSAYFRKMHEIDQRIFDILYQVRWIGRFHPNWQSWIKIHFDWKSWLNYQIKFQTGVFQQPKDTWGIMICWSGYQMTQISPSGPPWKSLKTN